MVEQETILLHNDSDVLIAGTPVRYFNKPLEMLVNNQLEKVQLNTKNINIEFVSEKRV